MDRLEARIHDIIRKHVLAAPGIAEAMLDPDQVHLLDAEQMYKLVRAKVDGIEMALYEIANDIEELKGQPSD